MGKNNEITCKCGWRVRLHVITCRIIIAYERNGCNVPWHVIANMEWNYALAQRGGRWTKVKRAQVLGKELTICSKWRKKIKQATKQCTKETHVFSFRLKQIKKQVTFMCKFEFGVRRKSKSMKMRVFIVFKGKMHFSWHISGQVCNFKLKYAWK